VTSAPAVADIPDRLPARRETRARGVASLGMYDPPWLHGANDALWSVLARHLRDNGFAAIPERLDRDRPLAAIWADPDLVLAQTCCYPLATTLAGAVTPVAAPVYAWPGCRGATHRSFLVVREASPFQNLSDLRGRRLAVNGFDSNTGMNLLRAAVAPLAGGHAFFGSVTVTGAHLSSMSAVARGEADLAAVDCVTFGLAARHRPDLAAGLRVIGETEPSPALPFVTRREASAEAVAAARTALRAALADAGVAEACTRLGLAGVEPLPADACAQVLALERDAVAAGYPRLA
jgi:ABC-type phosphate/phosphonate transport system substrate-binding protein